MKTILILALYLAAVVIGAVLIARAQTGVELQAKDETLPAGRLLETGDLVLVTDGSQYLPREVEKGKTIASYEIEVLETAVVLASGVPIAVHAPRDAAIARNFRGGDELFVCPANVPATFRALYCTSETAECIIVAEAMPADARRTGGQSLRLRERGTCEVAEHAD